MADGNAVFEWDMDAWDHFRTCAEMQSLLRSAGEQIKATAEGLSRSGKAKYEVEVSVETARHGGGDRKRAVAVVHPAMTPGSGGENVTFRSNLKHNSLVKGVKSAHV